LQTVCQRAQIDGVGKVDVQLVEIEIRGTKLRIDCRKFARLFD
jgi:hypothetical protein